MNTGIFGEGFPYSNFHDLNMDWIIKIAKDFLDQYTNIQNVINTGLEDLQTKTDTGLEDLQTKADTLEGLLQEWYNTHSEDIANQLANALSDLNEWYTTHENYLDATLASNILAFNTAADEKAALTIESIPDDYTALSNDVLKLKYAGLISFPIIEFRNGSVFNPDSTISIAMKTIMPIEHNYSYYVRMNRKPVSNAHFRIQYSTFTVDNGNTGYGVGNYIIQNRNVDLPVGEQGGYLDMNLINAVGFALSVYEVNTDATYNNLNITSEGVNFISIFSYNNNIKSSLNKLISIPELRNGAVANTGNADSVSTNDILPFNNAHSVMIKITKEPNVGCHYQIRYSTYPTESGNAYDNRLDRIRRDYRQDLVNGIGYIYKEENELGFAIGLLMIDDETGNFVSLREPTFQKGNMEIIYSYDMPYIETSPNYIIDRTYTKHKIIVKQEGTLTLLQAFCKYNDNYYSTDGSNIAVQDSTFTLTNQVSLNVGHGNSMQLGNSNIAYISGWDDNKIYGVDLLTLAITETITLPTTGYTTGVIDDLNKIAYIFQRDSYPNSEAYYNFIKYDYQNDIIISSEIFPVKMSAMQACDLHNGNIIIAYGLGTEPCPTGLIVCDKNANVISRYFIPQFDNEELEGVYIDRESLEVYISNVNKTCYRLY